MSTICFNFQIHQPFRLKRYRFFNIGKDHYYYDDFANENILRQIASRCYLPANRMLLDMMVQQKGKFKASFSISGLILDQFEIYAPEVIDGFREMVKTGCVEFIAEPYSHSLASLWDRDEFKRQVKLHADKIKLLFGVEPTVLRNTEMIYSDEISEIAFEMGYKKIITDGVKRVLGWKSPNYIYNSNTEPSVKLLLRNARFSEDISYRFSDYTWNDYPLTAEKYIGWISGLPKEEKFVNLFMNYETFGNMQPSHTGIFEFMKALPRFAAENNIDFATPSEIFERNSPIGNISVPHPFSWADEERDLSSWMGNTLQNSALSTLYKHSERVNLCTDRRLKQDWLHLQSSDHFYYMSTKHFSDGSSHSQFNPYISPYDAFNNYMNVLSDFISRVNSQYPEAVDDEELNSLLTTIHNQEMTIKKLETELNTVISDNIEKMIKQ